MLHNKDGELKSYRLFGLFNFTLLFLSTTICSASFENFKHQQESSFIKYNDKRDAAFNKFLKLQWQEYSAKQSAPFYEKEKPKSITPTIEKRIKNLGPMMVVKIPSTPKMQEKQIIDIRKKITQTDIIFDFFGEELGFNVHKSVKNAKFAPYSQVGIANFFDTIASSEYNDLLRDIKTKSELLELNDWGIYLLVMELSKNIFHTEDESKLFAWFLFNKMGYNVKVGLSSKHIILMHYSRKVIYSTPSYTFNKKKFYVLSNYAKGSSGRVYTYKQDYPNATKEINLSLEKLPKFAKENRKKVLEFKQYGKEYTIAYDYNQNLIDFMATYPQADYETYFNAPMQRESYESIAQDIKGYIDGEQASIALNFVLSFVQNAFEYERDNQQFGREKVMFAQETIYYDKSDCEDRAVLFAYLVKRLFKIGVIGVKYKNHMATGLYIPMRGDSVQVGKKKFLIADPTYVNANIGQSMPQYKSIIPQSYIVLKNSVNN